MRKLIYLGIIIILLPACKQCEVPKNLVSEEADKFSLNFFGLIYTGNIDSCLYYIEDPAQDDKAKIYLQNIHNDIRNWEIQDTAIVSYSRNKNMSGGVTENLYTITYDFTFDSAICKFEITSDKADNIFLVRSFAFQFAEN